MDDLDMLARDFGFGARGKANPMRSSAADHPRPDSRSPADDRLFSDVYDGPSKYTYSSYSSANSNNQKSFMGEFDHDSIFGSSHPKKDDSSSSKISSSLPVYDKPVYDEDIFDGLPGVKSKPASSIKLDDDVFASISSPPSSRSRNKYSSSVKLDDDVFATISSPPSSKSRNQYSDFSDLLGNFGRNEKVRESNNSSNAKISSASQGFDDLLGGFGVGSSANSKSPILEPSWDPLPASGTKHSSGLVGDPFVVLEPTSTTGSSSSKLFTDQREDVSKLGLSRNASADVSSAGGGAFNDLDPLNNFGNPVRSYSPKRDNGVKDDSPQSSMPLSGTAREMKVGNSSFGYSESIMENRIHVDKFEEPPSFDVPYDPQDFQKSFSQTASSPIYDETSPHMDMNHTSGHGEQFEDIWLIVSEIPLFTQPTNAPPPSRPPPPIPQRTSRSEAGSFSSSSRKKDDGLFSPSSYSHHSQSPKFSQPTAKESPVSPLDEFENFAKGLPSQSSFDGRNNFCSSEETNAVSAAAAMKDAVDKAEAKFRQAKEVREREYAKSVKNKESMQMEHEQDEQDSELKETLERLEHERNRKEDEERERIRLEKESEREKARQVVERANREARERAASEARERAASDARLKMERAAVQRAQAEARERAAAGAKEKAQKAAAEARERAAAAEAKERAEKAAAESRERVAAAEAKERAEKIAAEARERAAAAEAREKEAANKASAQRAEAEAKRRAERAYFERASAEARERAAAEAREKMAAAEAREKMAAAAKTNQQGYDNDLDSIFGMGRASSAPRSREDSTQFQNKGAHDPSNRTPVTSGVSSNVKKASSTSNIVDDLSSIFGASPSPGDFQEVEGESEERRKARYDRIQRTRERAAKALDEKNQRDIQTKKDQEERHRFAETLDVEIKRWAAGKEGNLRALLSTLQYVLWPECGWQPVSLTDLIMGASVKKTYRKATLCIHPDKVQQKGATLQQKYIAEKVFDLLKEAWNKLNSEELF